ncbi:MAG: hypothetical protein K0R69_2205 [Clostridia bacterium]|jgi:hypothetical protein|nr:hypothetical protein [Clostridia bacterium]
MKSKLIKAGRVYVFLVILMSFTGCSYAENGVSSSKIKMAYNSSIPDNFTSEKIIYCNDSIQRLEFDVDLRIETGDVKLEIIDSSDESIIWSNNYFSERERFKMELLDLKPQNEYIIRIQANKTKKIQLILSSSEKLVPDKEIIDKYEIKKKM